MRSRRTTTLIAALAAIALPLTACGSGGGDITAKGDPTPVDGGTADSGTDSGSGDTGTDSGDSGSDTPSDTTDLSIPDIAGSADDCIALGLAYASVAAGALGMTEDVAEMEQQFEEMKGDIPADLQDDLDVISAAFKTMADDGIMAGGEAMSTPEFEDAQANIEAYLNENCGGTGG